ncbi:hypothetical protein BDZ94DRAFT_1311622 [Collybia nuda]|uniref:Uncharacterized protein n=1 Tax=Collybia nuda TaxID=64659 RepID=A0A9P6CC46_9AGAR|nr:hypothetical protein BDZ94DRAFT_1311622 [Collybia nuda]
MTSHLVSLVPVAPLTDDVFSFNAKPFLEIIDLQKSDLKTLDLQPVAALAKATGPAGDPARGIAPGGGGIAKGGAGSFGQTVHSTPLFGDGLLGGTPNLAERTATSGVGLTESAANDLIVPTQTVGTHAKYSNNIQDHLPAVIKAVDVAITQFSEDMGNNAKILFGETATKGIQVIVGLEGHLAAVTAALLQMKTILTQDNVHEQIHIGDDKYRTILGTTLQGVEDVHLKSIADRLPFVIKTINDVGAAFTAIGASLRDAKEMIRAGVIYPHQIFAESLANVEESWRAYERKRQTLSYKI